MYKLFFEMLKQPLGLPISPIYEYILLLVIGEVAFQIAWNISPGGKYGSEIHWLVRIPIFLLIWILLYITIVIVKWVIAHWIILCFAIGGLIIFIGLAVLVVRKYQLKKS